MQRGFGICELRKSRRDWFEFLLAACLCRVFCFFFVFFFRGRGGGGVVCLFVFSYLVHAESIAFIKNNTTIKGCIQTDLMHINKKITGSWNKIKLIAENVL